MFEDEKCLLTVCFWYKILRMFLPLLCSAIVIIPSFSLTLWFCPSALAIHNSTWLCPYSTRFCPCFDCWVRAKSCWLGAQLRWLVNSKGKSTKLRKTRVKTQLHCKVGSRTQMPQKSFTSLLIHATLFSRLCKTIICLHICSCTLRDSVTATCPKRRQLIYQKYSAVLCQLRHYRRKQDMGNELFAFLIVKTSLEVCTWRMILKKILWLRWAFILVVL